MNLPSKIETDILIIGCGVAGLSLALKLAAHYKVLVVTKTEISETNTRYAQGGIASVTSLTDSFDKHVEDTLIAGDGLCDKAIVEMIVSKGPEVIQELLEYGAQFDRNEDGSLMLGKEGGHSEYRILHARDETGREVQRALVEQVKNHPNLTVLEHFFAMDFITQHHLGYYVNRGTPDIKCYGIYALDIQQECIHTILSRVTVLASGGAGNVYANTTNPAIATGDGIAMAYRAMARVANMEFNQFHPTALHNPGVRPAFLITEALRGKGAILKSPVDKQEFMQKYDPRLSLAPRDIVARAIDNEMKVTGLDFVYLDASHIPAEELKHEFPMIYKKCLERGIDITKDLIPVVPASHYICGGILVDAVGQSSIQNLYACGECTCSGLHGANRLASNSLLEGLVYAVNIYEKLKEGIPEFGEDISEIPDWNSHGTSNPEEWILISHNFREVQNVMSNYVGIVRSNARLQRAARRIDMVYHETEKFYRKTRISRELCELRNIIACAYLIIKSAKIRKESRGLHYTTDYPNKSKRISNTIL